MDSLNTHRRAAVPGLLALVLGLSIACSSSDSTVTPSSSGDGDTADGASVDAVDDASAPSGCGDGVWDEGEACDDGNAVSGDGCSASCDAVETGFACPTAGEPCTSVPYAALRAAGFDKYLGTTPPSSVVQDGNQTQYEWDVGTGPLCLNGGPYRMATRDVGSENLLIFLAGGGLCSEELCLANDSARKGMAKNGLLDPNNPDNPVADWNVAYLPYCDGSLFVGDTETQRGLHNLSVALDAIRTQFPEPRRIVITGSSGGGYGTVASTALMRIAFPDTELLVLNDSGPLLGRPGEPAFLAGLIEEFGLTEFVDAACEASDCELGAHITWLAEYAMQEDPRLRYGVLSSYQDFVIGTIFLGVAGPTFQEALLAEASRLESQYPGRFESFLFAGIEHTVFNSWSNPQLDAYVGDFFETTASGVTVAEWVRRAIEAPETWDSVRDDGDAE